MLTNARVKIRFTHANTKANLPHRRQSMRSPSTRSQSPRSPSSPFARDDGRPAGSPMLTIAFVAALVFLVAFGVKSEGKQRQFRGRESSRTVIMNRGLTDTVSFASTAQLQLEGRDHGTDGTVSLVGTPAHTPQHRRKRPSKEACKAFQSTMTAYFGPKMRYNTACPREARWFEAFRKVDPSPNKRFVNIGESGPMN